VGHGDATLAQPPTMTSVGRTRAVM